MWWQKPAIHIVAVKTALTLSFDLHKLCFSQIGCNAATKILDAALDGVAVDSNGAMFIIDVNPGVGNMFDAFMAKRASVNYNLQYVAMVHEDLSAEWFQETKAGSSNWLMVTKRSA